MTLDVIIFGAGGHAQVVADILFRMYETDGSVRPIGYLDDDQTLWGRRFLDLPVMGSTLDLKNIPHHAVVIAIGNNRIRKRFAYSLTQMGEQFVTASHPTAIIAPDVTIKPGTMICAGVIINTGSMIGGHVILNTGSAIDHHNFIHSYSHIAPGVHLGGQVIVEDGAFVGLGASVIPRVNIGAWSMVGSGAVVISDIPAGVTAVGVPAKPLRRS